MKQPTYQSVAINDVTVRHWPHDQVVNLLRRRRTRRFAWLTLVTSRDNDAQRDQPPPTLNDCVRPVFVFNNLNCVLPMIIFHDSITAVWYGLLHSLLRSLVVLV